MAIIVETSSTTVQKLIDGAARLTRVKGRGRALTGEDSAAWMETLNMMLESWALDNALIYSMVKENFTLASSANNYSIGSGGDFDTVRPEEILNMFIRAGGFDHPIVMITDAEYSAIGSKSVSTRPARAWYNPTYPTGTIYFESKPTVGESVHIDSLKPITTFDNLAQEVSLPPGYNALIKFNLAVEGANEYGRSVLPETAMRAEQLLNAVRRRNKRTPILAVDKALQGGESFNILTGSY